MDKFNKMDANIHKKDQNIQKMDISAAWQPAVS